jgi:methionyl-tRNA formyltransferase
VRLGRIAFLGTGGFGVPLLARLAEISDDLLVVSQPDRPAGRRLEPRAAPIAAYARRRGLRVETPARLRSDDGRRLLHEFQPDGLLLVAYGRLVPDELLSAFRLPPLNVHPSLLPRHRGAAPVAATILAGDATAGLSLMVMTSALDAGPVAEQWQVPLDGRETAPQLEQRLALLSATVVPPVLARWSRGELRSEPQDEEVATLVRPFGREAGRIDWRRAALDIDRQVRALQPWPGAWTLTDAGQRLHVRAASAVQQTPPAAPPGSLVEDEGPAVVTGHGLLRLETIQPEGRRPMPAADWRRGLGRAVARLGG